MDNGRTMFNEELNVQNAELNEVKEKT